MAKTRAEMEVNHQSKSLVTKTKTKTKNKKKLSVHRKQLHTRKIQLILLQSYKQCNNSQQV
jgi:hypothetical protein